MPHESLNGWEEAAARKRQQCLAAIPSAWIIRPTLLTPDSLGPGSGTNVMELDIPRRSGILSSSELAITENFTAKELLARLAAGEVTSEEVTIAFSKRAAIAQQLTNCLTETFFDRALQRAKFLDEYLKTKKKPVGPLHGLPISLKDTFNYEGIPSTIGYISFLKHPPATENSALVDILLDQGAVLYVKTNLPQTIMTADTENNIFGRTLNPLNLSLTAGGSSGGEGALVAFRGSPLGVGTDIGGSIRMPASCCGIYGFKPTSNRIPYAGQKSQTVRGYTPILACAGPLCTSFDDVDLFMEAVIGAKAHDYDGAVDGVPWRPIAPGEGQEEKLTIGVLAEDPMFPLHPPIRRALSDAAAKLEAAGHRIVHILQEPKYSTSTSYDLISKYFAVDPTSMILQNIKDGGEPMVRSVAQKSLFGTSKPRNDTTVLELGALNRQRDAIIDEWRKVWVKNKLDVLLAPPSQNTAVEHDTYNVVPYTKMWNLTNVSRQYPPSTPLLANLVLLILLAVSCSGIAF
jgi:amidase